MNACERVIRAIEFRNPDRVPLHWWHLPGAMVKYGKKICILCDLDCQDIYPMVQRKMLTIT